MEDTITAAIRKIIQEEVQAALVRLRNAPRAASEMPLRPGEVERQYSVKDAAELLGVSTEYIYSRMKDGELSRRLDLGGTRAKYRILASDLQHFIDSRTYEHAG